MPKPNSLGLPIYSLPPGKVKQVLSRSGCQREWEGRKEWVKEGEYCGSILYSCMKIE
jgi:hypothetical protein